VRSMQQLDLPCPSNPANQRVPFLTWRRVGCLTTGCIALLLGGCSVHYGNARNGVENAWGIGRVTWRIQPLTNGWASISSGTRLPGLVLGCGPDFFGFSLGYQVRERLQVVPAAGAEAVGARINGGDLAADAGHRWGIGQFTLRTPASSNIAVTSGTAGAGIGVALENGHPWATAGWQSQQLTTVADRDVFVELTGGAPGWPYFDFPSTLVAVGAPTNQTERSIAP